MCVCVCVLLKYIKNHDYMLIKRGTNFLFTHALRLFRPVSLHRPRLFAFASHVVLLCAVHAHILPILRRISQYMDVGRSNETVEDTNFVSPTRLLLVAYHDKRVRNVIRDIGCTMKQRLCIDETVDFKRIVA